VKQSQLSECLLTVLGAPAEATEERQAPLVTRHTLTEGRKQRTRILLAEDNPINQKVAQRILERLGYRVDAVADGAEAIHALEMTPYDLVLMDVQMPEMDGLEATRRIRNPASSVRDHQVPVLAITAHALKGDREQCLAAGMDDYVSKPVQPQELADVVEKWMAYALRDEATSPGPPATPPRGSVVDRTRLVERLDGDERLCDELLGIFIEDFPVQLSQLKDAFERDDAATIVRRGHAIKGEAANVESRVLRNLAHEIEKAARRNALDSVRPLLAQLETAFARLKEQLSEKTEEECAS